MTPIPITSSHEQASFDPPFPFFPTPAVPMEGDKASLIILIEQKYYWHQNVSNGDTNKSFAMRPKIWGDV